MQAPKNIQLIGDELALVWPDGREDFFPAAFLRAQSPSAENIGEPDILGRWHGGTGPRDYTGITITGWDFVGNYGMRVDFSDGHRTGIYSWAYLRQLSDDKRKKQA